MKIDEISRGRPRQGAGATSDDPGNPIGRRPGPRTVAPSRRGRSIARSQEPRFSEDALTWVLLVSGGVLLGAAGWSAVGSRRKKGFFRRLMTVRPVLIRLIGAVVRRRFRNSNPPDFERAGEWLEFGSSAIANGADKASELSGRIGAIGNGLRRT